jgi:hypothetical protein
MAANLDNGVILGALGSAFTNASVSLFPPTNMVIAAIQCVGDTQFTTLVAENPDKTFNTEHAANSLSTVTVDEGKGGIVIVDSADTNPTTFPPGLTLYGRWTEVKILSQASDSTGIIVYYGY